ncbi:MULTISPECIES: hypothetical protein [Acidobacteriaceae]|uniref:hypothetical protein n=1 Tax=Acidobacteriaceae TaxID=204434 RepID=UPI00131BB4CC|nr:MULTISPECIES: hypothetical protein [Acidobacteriaceae]MDW5264298.1 hypothetical protein [Edaphobacter sp.]
MNQAFRNLAAVLCMIMLIASSASCMQIASHSPASCSHCTKHRPVNQQTPVCCDAHHQPSSATTAVTIEQPAQISFVEASAISIGTIAILSPPDQLVWPPPHPPRLTLRI